MATRPRRFEATTAWGRRSWGEWGPRTQAGARGVGICARVRLSGRVFIPNTLNCQEGDPPPAGGTVHQNERKVTVLAWSGEEDTPPLIPIRWCEITRGGVGTSSGKEDVFPLESC